jgi:hypothetical protein
MATPHRFELRRSVLETDMLPLTSGGNTGSEGEIRTHGVRDLQSLALGHSATSL